VRAGNSTRLLRPQQPIQALSQEVGGCERDGEARKRPVDTLDGEKDEAAREREYIG